MRNINQKINQLIDNYQPGYSMVADFYRDEDIYRHDLEQIFYKKWIYAGHVSQIKESGAYFLTEFGNESVIVVRAKDGEVRAFANVCRHRGSRICTAKDGQVNLLVCPYHAWAYDLDGKLRSRREMPEGFNKEEFGLTPVPMSIFHGMIFINLDPDAPDLIEGFKNISSSLDIYGLEQTKVACQKTFSVDSNWKLAIENFMECYHCAPAHVEYAQSHALQNPSDYQALRPAMLARAKEIGFNIESVDQSSPEQKDSVQCFYNRSAMYEGFVTGSQTGEPVAPLLGSIKAFGGGAADTQFDPLTYAILYADHAVLYRFLATDVQKTDMEIIWLVNENAVEGKDYDLESLTWLWTVTTEADKTIILNNQKGVNSKFYQPGPLSKMEDYLGSFIGWYLNQIAV